ncbi:MAG: hypothetical protein ACK4UJ_00945 [Leptonema sp. (in: bacteria)]
MRSVNLYILLGFFGIFSITTEILETQENKFITKFKKQNFEKYNTIFYFYQNYVLSKIQFSYLIQNEKKTKNTLSSNLEFNYDKRTLFLFYGSYFLKESWNRTLFLREEISSGLKSEFYYRKLRGFYSGLENPYFFYGFFYLEDLSKGVFWGFKDGLVLWDFYYKKWLTFYTSKSKEYSFMINWTGEKKQNQGYLSFYFYNFPFILNIFGARLSSWDYYQYFEDEYNVQNKARMYQSYLFELSVYYADWFSNFVFFKKGDVKFSKSEIQYKILSYKNLNFYSGIDFYIQNLEIGRIQRESFNANIKIELDYEKLIYAVEFRLFKDFYNIIYKISYKKKNQKLIFAVLYQDFQLEKIPETFEKINFSNEDVQNWEESFKKEYFFDRSFIGSILEYEYDLDLVSFRLQYRYNKKFFSKHNSKEMQYWEGSFVIKF